MSSADTATFELPGFQGDLFHPGGSGFDAARAVFNAMIDRRPALIARCANADDVVAAVNLAREQGIPLSVYGGGHGVTGAAVVDEGHVAPEVEGAPPWRVPVPATMARPGGRRRARPPPVRSSCAPATARGRPRRRRP